MKKLFLLFSVVLTILISFKSQALTLNGFGGYRSGSHAYETRLKVSENWKSGWFASLETDSFNKTHENNNEPFGLSYNEIDTNYTIHLTDKLSLKPGHLLHWSSAGTRLGPYLKLSYDVRKDLNLGIRYRYDYNLFHSTDLNDNNSRAQQQRWDGYITYQMNDKWMTAWQTTVYTYVNDYRYNNNKTWATENAFVIQYKLTPTVAPYIEYDYLDKQASYNGKKNITENSYRVGISITL
ncbi:oligogalacturonate-specific porin KdgM family protein [Rouxiella sp. T17]|uniref:oligogalacturonate-specific porin KdgM family protein n=1 Tax=Rouxiella sp. T17 TaxID=3085684 RepID=UPI002FC87F28